MRGSPISAADGDNQVPFPVAGTHSTAGETAQVPAAASQPVASGANRPGSLLIAVVTCNAYRDRADAVRRTWGRDAKHILYVIGRPSGPEEIVGDTLFLDCPDTYESLTQKSFALCRYIRDHLNFDRVFKCDDDTLVNVAALEAAHCPADFFGYVHSETPSEGWRLHKGRRSQGVYRGPWVSGGLGYFLSRRAVSVLADCRDPEILGKEMFEDKAVSDALRLAGILPARLPGQACDGFLQRTIDGWAFSEHALGPQAMADAYSRMKATTTERVLTYHKLGANGRLGNQLWQIASTLGMAAYFRAKVSLSANWASRDVFSVPDDYFVDRQGCDAWQFPFRLPQSHTGWMQDWWNWWAVAPQIRDFFRPRPAFLAELRAKYAWFFEIPESRRLSVHVRRGDYVGQPHYYAAVSPAYYREAMARCPGMTPVIFSDDPGWCAHHLPAARIAPAPARPEEHFVLMSLCPRHIIANSTFSYWAAVVAGDEQPIYPRSWFGPSFASLDLDWSIPPGWMPLSSSGDAARAPERHGPFSSAATGVASTRENDNRGLCKTRYEHYYINLDSRPDRRRAMEQMFKRFETPVERVSASTGDDLVPDLDLSTFSPGRRGCFISHYRLLKRHLDECERGKGFDHVLAIYEDDALFCDDFQLRLEYVEKHLLETHPWDMCFLAAFFHDDPPYWHPEGDHQQTSIRHIHRAYGVFTAHAYLVNPASISKLLDKLRQHAGHAIDTTYCKIQPGMNCYVVVPGMAAQRAGYSNIALCEGDLTGYYMNAAGPYIFAKTEAEFDYDRYVFRQSTWDQHGARESPAQTGNK